MERQTITVDIAPGNNQIQRLKSSQGDIGRPLGVYITQNGVALDCSAYTADLYILKPDGNYFTATATVDATEHNLITWETAKQETPVAGDCAAQIRILSNGDDVGTARFVEYVEASPGFVGESSESVVESLMEYVRQAAASAETASGAASSATGSASAASGSASSAAQSASAAAGSASTAHTDAETASQAAQTAQDVAASIPEDYSTLSEDVTGLKSAFEQLDANVITESAGPAPIVSIADGADGMPMRSVEVAIDPVQDLHGYEYPWPAGGGKNLLPMTVDSIKAANHALTWDGNSTTFQGLTYTIETDGAGNVIGVKTSGTTTSGASFNYCSVLLPAGTYLFSNVGSNVTTQSGSGTKTVYVRDVDNSETLLSKGIDTTYDGQSFTLSAPTNVLVYNVIAAGYQVSGTFKPMIRLSSVSDATYAPYSNVCPISGWTGAKVTRTGKNICDESKLLLASGWTVTDGVYSGVNTALHNAFHNTKGGFPGMAFKPDTQYTVSFKFRSANDGKMSAVGFKYTDGTATTIYPKGTAEQLITLTSENGKNVSMVEFSYGNSDTIYISQLQVEEGTSASVFESYQGQTYEVAFPTEAGTVYGGTLDVVNGMLTVDRATVELNGTEEMFFSNNNIMVYGFGLFKNRNGTTLTQYLSSHYKAVFKGWASLSDNEWQLVDSVAGFHDIVNCPDLESGRAYITGQYQSGTPLQFTAPLKSPIEVQLTPQEIKTLLGINNIWADAGNVAITYPADTKMYIDRKITEAVANALNA